MIVVRLLPARVLDCCARNESLDVSIGFVEASPLSIIPRGATERMGRSKNEDRASLTAWSVHLPLCRITTITGDPYRSWQKGMIKGLTQPSLVARLRACAFGTGRPENLNFTPDRPGRLSTCEVVLNEHSHRRVAPCRHLSQRAPWGADGGRLFSR